MLARAREIAEGVLFPATIEVDRSGVVPGGHLDLLADEGFYGLAAPARFGGLGLDLPTAGLVLETLASGCLTTAFVWLQHHGVVRRLVDSPHLRDTWVPRLVAGKTRGGVALGGTLPGPPRLVARPGGDGYVLSGVSPWVTGWGMIDVLAVAARAGDDLVWALVDADSSPTLTAEPLPLVAVAASNTVTLTFTDHAIPADRVVGRQPLSAWAEADRHGLRMNGSLALGVVNRCAALLGSGPLDGALTACRARLDAAGPDELPDARAAASALAAHAATLLVASTGSHGILLDDHGQKLARESLFLLVFGSRPAIRRSLVDQLLGAAA